MSAPRTTLLVMLLSAFVGNGAFAGGSHGAASNGSVPALAQETTEGAAGQDSEPATATDPATLPATLPPIDIATTAEQEAALRLVEEILAEQRLLLSGQNFVYQSGVRRDPFRSLLNVRRREIAAPELRPAGLAGFLINEIVVAATANYQGRWQAMILGADQRSYFVEVGAVLYDGRVVEISGDEVIFEQDVEDLLGARSTQRISKRLVTGNQE